jgi:ubiquinone/menaquinone biosynthesis C-methylase UbiE
MTGQIKFADGAAYEQMMGRWSGLAGGPFLDWLAPRAGLSWVDVGCGNGAFTELLIKRCAPAEVQGIDPSEGQIAYARSRLPGVATFSRGDATALPFEDDRFDAAVMALVIFFVPDPVKGASEMARVVKPGGSVSAYVWDSMHGGSPQDDMRAELIAMGLSAPNPPSVQISTVENLQKLWRDAGLADVSVHQIEVRRTFASFDDYWSTSRLGPGVGQVITSMPAETSDTLQSRVRARLKAGEGPVTFTARANAVKGRVAGR